MMVTETDTVTLQPGILDHVSRFCFANPFHQFLGKPDIPDTECFLRGPFYYCTNCPSIQLLAVCPPSTRGYSYQLTI